MEKNPKVSIVIPVYNVEHYVEESVNSVLEQDYKDCEIICIDDGSTDRSGSIIDDLAKKHENVKAFHQENVGLAETRNRGIEKANGTYIYFLDSDDKIVNYAISRMVEETTKNNLDFLLLNGKTFYDEEDAEQKMIDFYVRNGYSGIKTGEDMFSDMMFDYKFRPQVSLYFFRKEFLTKHHLNFPEGLLYEDNIFAYKAHMKAEKVKHIEEELFLRRIRANSIMTSAKGVKNFEGYFETTKEILEYLAEHELEERTYHASCLLAKNCVTDAAKIYDQLTIEEQAKIDNKYFMNPKFIQNLLVKLECDYRDKKIFEDSNVRKDNEIHRLAAVRDDIYEKFKKLGASSEKKLSEQKEKNKNITKENNALKKEKEALKKEIKEIKKSTIYKVGRYVTYVPRKIKKLGSKPKRRIWLIGTPEFGNLGDHQIVEAELQFLHDTFPTTDIREVTMTEFWDVLEELKTEIKPSDLLFFHGGGNVGNIWPKSELIRRKAFEVFKKNARIVMPQSIIFTDDEEGRKEIELTKAAYDKDVILACRDDVSFKFAQENLKCKSIFVPDMVMYCKKVQPNTEREGALLCFRKDLEMNITDSERDAVHEIISKKCEKIVEQDTVIRVLTKNERKAELDRMFDMITKSSVIITDRLHGMIFSAISETPCVVFPNNNHKIEGGAQWLSSLDYVMVIHDVNELEEAVEKVTTVKERRYPVEDMRKKFDSFQKEIQQLYK